MTSFEKRNNWITGEKTEKKILDIIMESGLDYWEVLGMLEHMKLEMHRITDPSIEKRNQSSN